jgi:hypothetical protein
METVYSTSIDVQIGLIQVLITGLILFAAGFWLGGMKGKKLQKKIYKMEKEIMDLNSELLYNEKASPTMVKTASPN